MAQLSSIVQRLGQQLLLDGSPYRIVGGNNYYIAYVNEQIQDALFQMSKDMGMNALRIWAFLDAANAPAEHQVCFQFWDVSKKAPMVNDGPTGLERLDRAIAKADASGIRLILTLINNWKDFGGMPQYVQWFGLTEKDKNKFYVDPRCLDAYQNWVRQIVSRRNSITGRLYSDEPAILAWELANEPRCEGKGGVDTLLSWVETMSGFIRRMDANHLIAVGDEGYFKHARAWGNVLYNGTYGVSCEELLGIGNVDFGTLHLYPQSMAKGADPTEFGNMWIREHIEAAQRANKPMLVEEYGLMAADAERNGVFDSWLQGVERLNGLGDMLWMLGLPKSPDQPFDPDQYVVSDSTGVPSIKQHASRMLQRQVPAGSG